MRLGTFNLLHGRSLTDGRVEADRLAGAVAALDVDVLAMQEVDRNQPRSGFLDLTAVAATAMDATEFRFAPAVVGTPGNRFRPTTHDGDGDGEPCYGVSLVSRLPVRWWQVFRLRSAPVVAPVLIPGGRGPRLLRDEPRTLLAARIEAPFGPVTVAATHLSFVPGWNAWQLRQAVRLLRQLPGPRLLLGDLNLPAVAVGPVSGWRLLARTPTYPSTRPVFQVDHVLADRRSVADLPAVTAVRSPLLEVSDHRPVVVELAHR